MPAKRSAPKEAEAQSNKRPRRSLRKRQITESTDTDEDDGPSTPKANLGSMRDTKDSDKSSSWSDELKQEILRDEEELKRLLEDWKEVKQRSLLAHRKTILSLLPQLHINLSNNNTPDTDSDPSTAPTTPPVLTSARSQLLRSQALSNHYTILSDCLTTLAKTLPTSETMETESVTTKSKIKTHLLHGRNLVLRKSYALISPGLANEILGSTTSVGLGQRHGNRTMDGVGRGDGSFVIFDDGIGERKVNSAGVVESGWERGEKENRGPYSHEQGWDGEGGVGHGHGRGFINGLDPQAGDHIGVSGRVGEEQEGETMIDLVRDVGRGIRRMTRRLPFEVDSEA